jgi:hypothetical protein
MKIFFAGILSELRVLRAQQLILGLLLLFHLSSIPESELVSVIPFLLVNLRWRRLLFGAAPVAF